MSVKRVVTVLLLLLSLLAFQSGAAAFTLSDFHITSNGVPLSWVSPQHEQLVDIHFTSDTTAGYVLLDLSQLHTNPATMQTLATQRVQLDSCIINPTTGMLDCTLPNILLQPGNESAIITAELWSGGSRYPHEFIYAFNFDETAPKVISITTDVCDEVRCYIASNRATTVTVELEDSVGSFDKHLIFYQLGSERYTVDECTGMTCTGTATLSCADGASLDLKVTNANSIPSQDDAGNPVSNPGEVQPVRCDAAPPRITNLVVTGNHPLGLITEDGSLLINATIEETTSRVTMTANLSQAVRNTTPPVASTQCTKTENFEQECLLSVTNLHAGRNIRVPLTFTDQTGNTATTQAIIPAIHQVANATTRPNFFQARATSVTPETINRVALQLAFDNAIDYPFFINYELSRLGGNARILQQSMSATTCEVVRDPRPGQSNLFTEQPGATWERDPLLFIDPIRVFSPTADWDEPNRLDASLLHMENVNDVETDLLLVRCNLSLVVENENELYSLPEVETLYFPLRLRNSRLGQPGAAFLEKIEKEREDLNSGVSQLIGYANTLTSTFAHLCQLENIMNVFRQQSLGIESVGLLLQTTGLGQNLAQSGNQLWNGVFSISLQHFIGKKAGEDPGTAAGENLGRQVGDEVNKADTMIRKFCNYVHCDIANKTVDDLSEDKKKLLGADDNFAGNLSTDGSGPTAATWNRMTENLNVPDVSNSLIMSVATQCYSGVVYNLNKYRQIDCGYLQCLKEQSLQGHSIAPCDEARGVKMCRFVTGEVFELPYIRVVKNLAANVNQIIQAPITLLWDHLNAGVCRGTEQEITWKGFGCRLMKTFSQQKDFEDVTQYNLIFTYPYEADMCALALCEGDDCDRQTNSLIEELLPGTGYAGEQYRTQRLNEREEKFKKQQGLDMINNLNEQIAAGARGTTIDRTRFNEYAELHNIKDEERNALWNVLTNEEESVVGGSVTVGQSSRNTLENRIKTNQPIISADQLRSLARTGNTKAKLISQNPRENDEIADTLEAYKVLVATDGVFEDAPCDSELCSLTPALPSTCDADNPAYNKELCDRNEYSVTISAVDRLGFMPCMKDNTRGICPCKTRKNGKCVLADGDGFLNEEQIATAAETARNSGEKLRNIEEFYDWVDALGNVLYTYLEHEGYVENLKLSGWGDWGAELAADADLYLNPESWKDNLCNPAGTYKDFTRNDGSVYTFQSGAYRAVLTFAGEQLPIQERADTSPEQTLYTVSAVVVSPFEPNTMRATLEPGGRSIGEDSYFLPVGEQVVMEASHLAEEHFDQLCIRFEQDFPQPGGERRFCRQLQAHAYDRGAATNATMEEFGTDPYRGGP